MPLWALCHLLTQAAVDRLTKESIKASKEDPLGSPLVTTRPAFSEVTIESDLLLVLKFISDGHFIVSDL